MAYRFVGWKMPDFKKKIHHLEEEGDEEENENEEQKEEENPKPELAKRMLTYDDC